MKRVITFSAGLFVTIIMLAQAPEKISYQAVIRNSSDQLVTETQVGMKISILQGTAAGSPVYIETQTPTTNANGLVSIEIGTGTTSDDISSVDWTDGPYFIKTETDPAGGSNYTITGTSQLLSVPYALHAKTAETVYSSFLQVYTAAEIAALSPSAGEAIYNSTENLFQIYDGNRWVSLPAKGNTYNTVWIGDQEWMAENLKTTKYNDGTDIPNVNENTDWRSLSTGAYAWYENDEATYGYTYGALYNWYAVETGNLCPSGWHVPTDAEWKTLEMHLGMSQTEADDTGWRGTDEGGKLKEIETTHWNSPNTGATNETGFTALPGGHRDNSGSFSDVGDYGVWWSATEDGTDGAWGRYVGYGYSGVGRDNGSKEDGLSVRCVRD